MSHFDAIVYVQKVRLFPLLELNLMMWPVLTTQIQSVWNLMTFKQQDNQG